MSVVVALCGLTARDSRLLEVVINRAGNGRHNYQALQVERAPAPAIAIIDASSTLSREIYQNLRRSHPGIVSITISDNGMVGDTRYRIERKSLFLQVMRVLDDLVTHEISGNKVMPHAASLPPPSPTAQQPAQPATVSNIGLESGRAKTALTALVVDDSLAVREQLREALRRLGIACDDAENAEVAMNMLLHKQYDIALLDVVMPGTDGYELCRKIKHNNYMRLMPVLMLTSRSSPFDRARGALSGCDSYLTKPISLDTFSQAIDKVLMKHFRNDRTQMLARGYRN